MKAVAAAEEEAAKYAMEEGNKAGAGVARKMLADQGKAIRAEAGPEGERLGGEAGEKAGGDAGKYKEFFRACNVLPFSCTHLALWRGRQGKRHKVDAKQKGLKNFFKENRIEF